MTLPGEEEYKEILDKLCSDLAGKTNKIKDLLVENEVKVKTIAYEQTMAEYRGKEDLHPILAGVLASTHTPEMIRQGARMKILSQMPKILEDLLEFSYKQMEEKGIQPGDNLKDYMKKSMEEMTGESNDFGLDYGPFSGSDMPFEMPFDLPFGKSFGGFKMDDLKMLPLDQMKRQWQEAFAKLNTPQEKQYYDTVMRKLNDQYNNPDEITIPAVDKAIGETIREMGYEKFKEMRAPEKNESNSPFDNLAKLPFIGDTLKKVKEIFDRIEQSEIQYYRNLTNIYGGK